MKKFPAHPNIKLFISHGGLLSIIESVYHGVPIIGVPIFGDQPGNVAFAVSRGFGLQLNKDDLKNIKLKNVIEEVLQNPK